MIGILIRGELTGNQQQEVEIKAGITGESQELSCRSGSGSGGEQQEDIIRRYTMNEGKNRWFAKVIARPQMTLRTMVL